MDSRRDIAVAGNVAQIREARLHLVEASVVLLETEHALQTGEAADGQIDLALELMTVSRDLLRPIAGDVAPEDAVDRPLTLGWFG